MSFLDDLSKDLTNTQIPGGCDDCDAHQTFTKDDHGIYHLTTHHDNTCPWLAAYQRRRS